MLTLFSLLAMQIKLSKVFAVVITGLVVVFIGLIILILFVNLFGMIMQKTSKQDKKKEEIAIKAAPEISAATETVSSVSSDDEDETVAAIAAAVAYLSLKDGKNYKIKSIKKASGKNSFGGSVWGSAGQRENTRPFF